MRIYVSTDGDDIGTRVGRAALANREEEMIQLSNNIKRANEQLVSFALEHGGKMLTEGGDEANFTIPAEKLKLLPDLRERWKEIANATLSVGIGRNIAEAGKALMAAKLRGKDQIVLYAPSVEEDIERLEQQIQAEHSEESRRRLEQQKIGEGYFKAEDEPDGSDLKLRIMHALQRSKEQQDDQDDQDLPESTPMADEVVGQPPDQGVSDQMVPDQLATDQVPEAPAEPSGEIPPEQAAESPEAPVQGQEDQAGGNDDVKARLRNLVGSALMQVHEAMPRLEEMRREDPEVYRAIFDTVQAMLDMAQQVLGEQPQQSEDSPPEAPVATSEQDPSVSEQETLAPTGAPEGVEKKELIPGGEAAGKKPEDFDPKALAEGIKVEMEHTDDPKVAQEITMDHLTEDPNYYSKLKAIHKD